MCGPPAQAWNAGDMDAYREMHDPDVILRPERDWPEPGPYIGREAVMGFYQRIRETFETPTRSSPPATSVTPPTGLSPGGSGTPRGTDLSRIWT